MTGENLCDISAEYACGQILFTLKNSKLNYVVKKTPYSAYITVRKTLLKSVDRAAFEAKTKYTIAVNLNIKNVEKENSRLRERNLDIERDYALMRIEFEELELKCGELKDINDKLDDKNAEHV